MRSSTPQLISKALVLLVLVCVLGPVRALAQDPATGNLNAISSVNVRGGTVEIVGTKKPNFTTFTLTDPPRLVIDISEAIFNGVAEDIAVGNGTVTAIRTASYGSDESAIARVLIGYEREVETDIQARGNSLVVSVAGASGGEAVAAASTNTGTTGAGAGLTGAGSTGNAAKTGPTDTDTNTGTASTGTAPTAQGSTAAQAQPSDEERLRQAAQAAKAAQDEQKQQQLAAAQAAKAAQEEKQQVASAQAAEQARTDAETRRQAQARAEAERKAQEESTRVAQAQAEQQRAEQAEQQRAQAQAAEKQRQETARAEADARRESAAQAAETRKRQAAEERTRREEEAQAAADARRQQAEEKQRQQQEEKQRQQEARQTRVAQAQTPAPVERSESSGPPSVSSRRKTMTLVGFRQEPAASRVFVRTNEPVRYSISKGSNEVVVELENTRITEDNNTLPLDTSFFNTSVASVAARSGPARTVRVSIRLKQQVPYQTRQEGNELMIDFQRPARR